ncbi:hypothetical protein ACQP2F_06535 [Actinoplanes sp. CA-030573]|uniref:hypothetical protein n=1 Tax=Actinoplanes sp. CA-030573 TaxID=3239898 RepID=UPI003D9192A7
MHRIASLVLLVALTAGCGIALTAGCSVRDRARSSPDRPSPSVILSSETAMVDDPPGTVGCALLGAAITAGSLMTPGVVDDVVAATRDADAPLADAATRLGDAYKIAVAAAGKADEPDKVAAVGAAASDMSGVCAESGLKTAG